MLMGVQRKVQFPLKVHSSGRYLVDALGNPTRLYGDAYPTLTCHQSQANVSTYLQWLADHGFNAFQHMLVVRGGAAFSSAKFEPNNFSNVAPFSTANDFSTVNDAYFDDVGVMVRKAARLGITVLMYPAYAGPASTSDGWESIFTNGTNTNTVCFNYGAYIARRLNYPNLCWVWCGDHTLSSTALTRTQQIIQGIQSVRRDQMAGSVVNNPDTIADDQSGITLGTNPASADQTIRSVYGIGASKNGRTYVTADRAWAASPTLPAVLQQPAYLNNSSNIFNARKHMRKLHFWSTFGGCWAGGVYGDEKRYTNITSGFGLDTLTDAATLDRYYANQLFASLSWHLMRPSGTATGYAGRVLVPSRLTDYATNFDLNETPVSEEATWTSNAGLDWTAVNTSGGLAVGTQTGSGGFDDSYAHLTGTWSADHEVSAVIHKGSTSGIMEVEILLRVTDSAHSVTLYECNLAHDGAYLNVYRWQGPKGTVVGDFIQLGAFNVPGGVTDGKVFKARIVGNVITVFYDGTQIGQATDTAGGGGGAVLTSGNPGIGFYKETSGTASSNFCFTSVTATDYPPASNFSSNPQDDRFLPSSMSSDGKCLVVYVPPRGTTAVTTFAVDCRSLAGTSRARWWNPTTGVYSTNASAAGTFSIANTASAQSFTTPGDNGTSTNDWVLVMDN